MKLEWSGSAFVSSVLADFTDQLVGQVGLLRQLVVNGKGTRAWAIFQTSSNKLVAVDGLPIDIDSAPVAFVA